jgi:hypothetical protein
MKQTEVPENIRIPDERWNKLVKECGYTMPLLADITGEKIATVRFWVRRFGIRPQLWEGLEPIRLKSERWKQPRYRIGEILWVVTLRQLQNLFPRLEQVDTALEEIGKAVAQHGDETVRYGHFLFPRDPKLSGMFFTVNEVDKAQKILKLLAEQGIACAMFFPIGAKLEAENRLRCWAAGVDYRAFLNKKLESANREKFEKEIAELFQGK